MGNSTGSRIKIPFTESEINKIRNFLKISKMDETNLLSESVNPINDLLK